MDIERKTSAKTDGGNESMSDLPNCPKCNSEYTYEDRSLFVCPKCSNEWTSALETENSNETSIIKDANVNVLNDGDTVSVIKDLKVKGSSSVIKIETKVKNIRLVDRDHDIDWKIDGFGAMQLKSHLLKRYN
jgi:protein PhnA